ncbi:MAG: YggT family protein [Actinomycetota bacterium]|jgi:YggT family protein|nr:YggT family protein [Actinomycetota bacterium]MDQ3530522.1 YggT family protein [Actinomycetota bacterium]
MDIVLTVVCVALDLYFLALLLRIILSYVPALPEPLQPIARFVRSITDPLLLPLRGLIPPVRIGAVALDLSPLILFVAIRIVRGLLCSRAGMGLF